MSIQAIVLRITAVAAVVFIAVLVWRVGTTMMFDDANDRVDWDNAVPADGAANAGSAEERHAAVVVQAADGGFHLTPGNAGQWTSQLKVESVGGTEALGGWRTDADSAVWRIRLERMGDGYFRARIRYRCMQSARMQARVAEKRLAIWTLPESSSEGVEEKMIRLTKPGDYELAFSPVGAADSLQIVDIELTPRR